MRSKRKDIPLVVFPASKLIILHVNMVPKSLGFATAHIAMCDAGLLGLARLEMSTHGH
jgi:hypothetical protein